MLEEQLEVNLQRLPASVFLGNQQESAAEAQVDPMAHATDTVPSSKCMRLLWTAACRKTPHHKILQNTSKYIVHPRSSCSINKHYSVSPAALSIQTHLRYQSQTSHRTSGLQCFAQLSTEFQNLSVRAQDFGEAVPSWRTASAVQLITISIYHG